MRMGSHVRRLFSSLRGFRLCVLPLSAINSTYESIYFIESQTENGEYRFSVLNGKPAYIIIFRFFDSSVYGKG